MHHIQAKILNALLYAESLSYSAMRPANVESNHFAYHLDRLLHDKVIAKEGRQYVLSPQGLALVDRLSQEKMGQRPQPSIVTVLRIKNSEGRTLLFKRKYQPYIYRLGLPSGKIHLEESIVEAAYRELQEKTSLADVELTHRGVLYLETKQDDFTLSKVMAHLFDGQSDGAPKAANEKRGTCLWGNPETYTADELMPAFTDMVKLLDEQEQFFFHEIVANA